jgi:hypothetical protein
LAGVLLLVGCSASSGVKQPKYSPGAVADAAMGEFDKNKDDRLDEKELQACPSLFGSLADLDKDGDRAVGRDELMNRILTLSQSKSGLLNVACKVTRGGQPLANAEVKFIPEKFHGDSMKPASGKSDAHGAVDLRVEGSPDPGLFLGFYRVEVSVKDAGGQETIPAAYNTQTTLGQQVHAHMRGAIYVHIP